MHNGYARWQGLAMAIALALSTGVPAIAAQGPQGKAVAPLGFQLLCLRSPEFCRPGGAAEMAMTARLLQTLRQVNRQVNLAIRPRSDGSVDAWTLNTSSGDCEDYVLAKRQKLMSLGLPASALRIAQVRTAKGEGHAILVVHTDQGDFALDNLSPTIRKLGSSGYHVVAMSTADPLVWN
jgi:predicted transglutaminase-like cysteine proteinase